MSVYIYIYTLSYTDSHTCICYLRPDLVRMSPAVPRVFVATYFSSAPGPKPQPTVEAAMTGEDSPRSSCLAAKDDHESIPSAQL